MKYNYLYGSRIGAALCGWGVGTMVTGSFGGLFVGLTEFIIGAILVGIWSYHRMDLFVDSVL